MAKNAEKIFSGPVLDVLIRPSGSGAFTTLGLAGATVNATWEANGVEVSEGHNVLLNGTGKIEVETKQTDSGSINLIKSGSTALQDVCFIDVKGNEVTASGMYLTYNLNRSFAVGEAHGLTISGQRVSPQADDWITFN